MAHDLEHRIPFVSLLDRDQKLENKINIPADKLEVAVLTKPADKSRVPAYHQQLSELEIDYSSHILIYLTLKKIQRPGYQLRVKKVLRRKTNLLIKLAVYCCKSSYSLEVIDIPFTIIKIARKNLPTERSIDFKFLSRQDCLLTKPNVNI